MSATPITHLFLDIGGVLLTNGWDRHCRRDAAQKFGLDLEDLNDRHKMSFDTYEEGKLNLDTYLNHVLFYEYIRSSASSSVKMAGRQEWIRRRCFRGSCGSPLRLRIQWRCGLRGRRNRGD